MRIAEWRKIIKIRSDEFACPPHKALAGGEFGEGRNGALEAEGKWQKAVSRSTIDDGRGTRKK